MKKIFLAVTHDYDYDAVDVPAAFSTEDKAKKWIASQERPQFINAWEVELDPEPTKWKCVGKDGTWVYKLKEKAVEAAKVLSVASGRQVVCCGDVPFCAYENGKRYTAKKKLELP